MGIKAKYSCNNCGRKFEAYNGGGFCYNMYRCENCDHTTAVENGFEHSNGELIRLSSAGLPGPCKLCGGRMSMDLSPMCKACKSRDVQEEEILMYLD